MKNFFRISEKNPELPKTIPINRAVRSSFHIFEKKQNSKGVSVKIPLKGTEKYILENRPFTLNEGNFLLVNNEEEIEYSLKSKSLIEGLCLYIDETLISQAVSEILNKDEKLLDEVTSFQSIELASGSFSTRYSGIEEILKLLPNPQNDIIEEEFFYQLAFFLANKNISHRARFRKLRYKKPSTGKEVIRRLENACSFIRDNLHRNLSIKEISGFVLMSEYHFIRSFKKCYKISPWKFIIEQRILKARELLKNPSSSVSEVAVLSGFSDIHSFSRTFRKITGQTPSGFKNSF